MFKVSLAVIGTLVLLITCFKFFLIGSIASVYYTFLAKFFIVISLFVGILTACHENKENIDKYFFIKRNFNAGRIFYKLLTIFILFISSVLFSFIMVNFFDNDIYNDYLNEAILLSPIIFLFFTFWIIFIDKRQENPEDQYYTFSKEILRFNLKIREYKVFLLSALVKIFYLPLMYGSVVFSLYQVMIMDINFNNPGLLITYLFYVGISFDVIIACGGYLLSSKYMATESLSVDDTFLGWFVCLLCYPPLLILYRFFTEQADTLIWTDWLNESQFLYWIWASLICATWICYWFSTLSFGFRFSNLSWRGLVDTGLYKYTKHPAYLSKNLYWWLHTVPFFGVLGLDILRNFLALSFVSLVYYLRAKTEERHLMRFEEYRAYQTMILEKGLWAKLQKIIKN